MNSLTHSCIHSFASFAILAFSGRAFFIIRATGAEFRISVSGSTICAFAATEALWSLVVVFVFSWSPSELSSAMAGADGALAVVAAGDAVEELVVASASCGSAFGGRVVDIFLAYLFASQAGVKRLVGSERSTDRAKAGLADKVCEQRGTG